MQFKTRDERRETKGDRKEDRNELYGENETRELIGKHGWLEYR